MSKEIYEADMAGEAVELTSGKMTDVEMSHDSNQGERVTEDVATALKDLETPSSSRERSVDDKLRELTQGQKQEVEESAASELSASEMVAMSKLQAMSTEKSEGDMADEAEGLSSEIADLKKVREDTFETSDIVVMGLHGNEKLPPGTVTEVKTSHDSNQGERVPEDVPTGLKDLETPSSSRDLATFAPGPLTEHITCGVCLEMYTNPHTLRCLHTYCYKCIQGLKKGDQVQCPECRKYTKFSDINKEFKVQRLIDQHINYVEDMFQSQQKELEKHKTQLEDKLSEIEKGSKSTKGLISDISDNALKQVEEVNRHRKNIIELVNQHHDQLIKDLRLKDSDILDILKSKELLLSQGANQLEQKITLISNVSQTGDVSLRTDAINDLNENIKSELQKLNADLQKADPQPKSPVIVVKGEDWDPKTSTRIEVSQDLTVRNKAIHQGYGQVKSVNIKYQPSKLCVYTDELWVGGGDKGVFVYDLDVQHIKNITHSQFRSVTSVLKPQTDTIVCDMNTGLHRLNQQGDYIECINEGCFSDVGLYNEQLFGLNFKEHCVHTFTKTKNSWVKDTVLQLSRYNKGRELDKLCVTSGGLYISCWSTHCVQCYSHTGQFVYQTGEYGGGVGEVVCPILSDVDSGGRRLLVCDYHNHRLQVLDTETREWSGVIGRDRVGYPKCAGWGDKHLWVGSGYTDNYKLVKYEVKGE